MSDTLFKKIRFRNFMAFGNTWTDVELDVKGTTFIVGENLDEGGSSGAGKTTVINAISYALYDKVVDISSKDGVINTTNVKKNTSMEVEFTFEKGGHVYRVLRYRGEKTGYQLFEDNVDITPTGPKPFNNKVEDLIGFSYNLFSKIVLFNGNGRPFLSLAVGEQRILIEELFKITTLSRKANACKRLVSETDKSIAMQKLLIQQQEAQNEKHRKHLAEAKQRAEKWQFQHDVELQKVADQIQKLDEIDFEGEAALHEQLNLFKTQQTTLQTELKVLQTEVASKEKSAAFPQKTELALLKSDITKKKSELTKASNELQHLRDAKCPYCLQQFADANTKINALEEKEANLTEEIGISEEAVTSLTAAEVEHSKKVAEELSDVKNRVMLKQAELNGVVSTINDIKSALNFAGLVELETAKNSKSALHDKLVKMSGEVNPLLEGVQSLETEGEIKIDHQALDDLVTLQAHQQFLVKLLMDKNSFIRKNIVSKTIPFLNKRIGYYTEKLNLPHVVLFQPDMSCQITQLGRLLDHGMMSNGEKKRLNLSLCFAFRDVQTFLHSKVNVLFTDEVDGGSLCEMNINSMIQLFKQKAWDDDIAIFAISHSPHFESRLDRTWTVRKEQGFSQLFQHAEG